MTAPSPHRTGTDKLRVEVHDGVARLTFDDPATRNALSADVRAALPGALRALQADPDVRVVVVTGAGDRAFVSGANIAEFAEQRTSPEARRAYDEQRAQADRAWAALDRPVVAMVRGACLGGGLRVALQADVRLAAEGSRFGVPAARLGLGYALADVEALAAVVGPGWAAEMLFSARHLDAAEALAAGLVTRVVPADRLEDEVAALARSIAANAPRTVAAAKAALRQLGRPADQRDPARVAALVEACFRSQDYREGQAAFLAKRPPRFTGR